MALTYPIPTVTAGEFIDTPDWNALVDSINFHSNPPACRVYNNAAQSITDNTETTVAFNSERYDTDSMHSTSVNTSRITFNTAGLYVVGFLLEFTAAADYFLCYASLRLNGTTQIDEASSFGIASAASAVKLRAVTTYKFAANDYLEIRAYQDNTANAARNLQVAGQRAPEFWATWAGVGT